MEEAAVEEEEGHDELPELPEEQSAFEDHGEGEEEGVEADQEQDEEVEQEEEGVEADQEQHEEVEQEEEGVEADQEQDEEVEQEEEGVEADQEQHEEVAVEQEEEVVEGEMQEGDRRGEGDEWSDFSSRDPVLTLSLFGAVCFRVWFVGWFSFIGWLYCSNEKTFIQSQSLSLSPSSLSSLSRGSSIAFI